MRYHAYFFLFFLPFSSADNTYLDLDNSRVQYPKNLIQ